MPFAPAVALALAVALLAVPAIAPATSPTFGARVTLPSSTGFGEPSAAVAPDGALYVAAPGSHTAVWRSTNGGASFARVHDSLGASGDSDIAFDADGTLYASDLFSNVPVSVSFDRATSFAYSTMSATGGSIDRQWLAGSGHGTIYSIWRDGSTERVAASHDQGRTWTRSVAATGVGYQGNPVMGADDNSLYIPIMDSHAALAITHDGGATWTRVPVAYVTSGAFLFPAVARDVAGTLYYAWAEGGTQTTLGTATTPRIVVTSSADEGAHWTPLTTLSTPGTINVFPWLAADAAGHVFVAWYEGVPPLVGTTPNAAAGTSWYVETAYAADANTATPSWTIQRATGVIHTGPICTNGIACVPAANPVYGNRILLDFFEIAEMPSGNLAIAFAGDTTTLPSALTGTNDQLYVVVQNGGPNLK